MLSCFFQSILAFRWAFFYLIFKFVIVLKPFYAFRRVSTRSGEVEFLLRRPMNNDEDIEQTLVAAEAGLQFVDQVCKKKEKSVR